MEPVHVLVGAHGVADPALVDVLCMGRELSGTCPHLASNELLPPVPSWTSDPKLGLCPRALSWTFDPKLDL